MVQVPIMVLPEQVAMVEGSQSGSYNFLGMLQTNGNEFTIADETITLDAIVAAEVYGNTESHSWSKSTNGGLVAPAVFAFSNSKIKLNRYLIIHLATNRFLVFRPSLTYRGAIKYIWN